MQYQMFEFRFFSRWKVGPVRMLFINHYSMFIFKQMDKLWRTVVKATQTIPDSLSLTPLDGLAGWCVKTPFAPELVTSSLSTSGRNNSDTLSYTQLHSRLHYGYLKSLLASKPALKVS